MINMFLICKYGIRGMTNDDLRAMIKFHRGRKRLVQICRRQLKFNLIAGRD